MELFIIIWIGLSIVVGYIAKGVEGKFWPAFTSSMIMSPIIAYILTMIMHNKIKKSLVSNPIKTIDNNEKEVTPTTLNTTNNVNRMNKEQHNAPYQGYLRFAVVLIVVLLLTIPFHYVPSQLKAFPKESFTFSNTFIFQSDIDRLIKRWNDASIFDKDEIEDEPLFKKLMQEGFIWREKSTSQDLYNEENK